MSAKQLDGSKIVKIQTIDSTFSNGCVNVIDDEGKVFKLHTDELLKIVSEHTWNISKKKVHEYLTIDMQNV